MSLLLYLVTYMGYQFTRLFHSLMIFKWIKLHHYYVPCSGKINKDINKSYKYVTCRIQHVHHVDVTGHILRPTVIPRPDSDWDLALSKRYEPPGEIVILSLVAEIRLKVHSYSALFAVRCVIAIKLNCIQLQLQHDCGGALTSRYSIFQHTPPLLSHAVTLCWPNMTCDGLTWIAA